MNVQHAVKRCLRCLAVVVFGAAVPCLVVWGQAEPAEVVRKLRFEETNLDTGESYRGDILSGAGKAAFLKAHNDARQAVGLDPLTWSDDIAAYSLSWIAENRPGYLDAARAGKLPALKHRPHEDGEFQQKYGENLAAWNGLASTETNASAAVSAWLQEKAAFEKLNELKPYIVGDEAGKTDDDGKPIRVGHYTQIVWKDTTKLGAAMFEFKLNGERTVVVVCNYSPRGNRLRHKPY